MIQTPLPPPEVFIDSSVLVAAAISASGTARLLRTAGLLEQVSLFFSDDVFEETERNLEKKAPVALPALRLFLEAFRDRTVQPDEGGRGA